MPRGTDFRTSGLSDFPTPKPYLYSQIQTHEISNDTSRMVWRIILHPRLSFIEHESY